MLVLIPAANASTDHEGKIVQYQLNSLIPDQMCIYMDPLHPDHWVCLKTSNPFYTELNALILTAYAADKTCMVSSDGVVGITVVTCK